MFFNKIFPVREILHDNWLANFHQSAGLSKVKICKLHFVRE